VSAWGGKTVYTHRLAFFMAYGYWPVVCRHTCDNPPCCNPGHLLDGTQADNLADARERGGERFPIAPGSHNLWAKLTDQDVRDIRRAGRAGITGAEITGLYGVSRPTIYLILQGKTWRHVKGT
jgi:hypothetical protein